MSDRELLELAAKAAGIEHQGFVEAQNYGSNDTGLDVDGWRSLWNPLTDDGDALRLAVKLEITVYPPQPKTAHYDLAGAQNHGATIDVFEPQRNDPYAATRRAIVRAAAEIGRTMP